MADAPERGAARDGPITGWLELMVEDWCQVYVETGMLGLTFGN